MTIEGLLQISAAVTAWLATVIAAYIAALTYYKQFVQPEAEAKAEAKGELKGERKIVDAVAEEMHKEGIAIDIHEETDGLTIVEKIKAATKQWAIDLNKGQKFKQGNLYTLTNDLVPFVVTGVFPKSAAINTDGDEILIEKGIIFRSKRLNGKLLLIETINPFSTKGDAAAVITFIADEKATKKGIFG